MANAPASGTALCDCSDPAQKVAVILYPSLGTPLLLTPDQKKCSIFIATASLGQANTQGAKDTLDKHSRVVPMDGDEDKTAAATVARHLRLVSMKGPKPVTDIKVGGLTGDGKDCSKAKSAIKVWQVAKFQAGALIYNQKGEAFATVSPQAVTAYAAAGFGGGAVYEVELELAQLAVKPESGTFMSFAWMVEPTKAQKENLPTLCAAATVHSQDLLVESFLASQVSDRHYRHQAANNSAPRKGKEASLVEYDVEQTSKKARSLVAGSERLAAWHPVIRLASKQPLKLGHLSDVHINVRHNALAKSPARVIEDEKFAQPPVGARVCNSFNALKELFDKISPNKKPDTALLLTGDLIDFNRNIDPKQVGDDIGGQWKKFNVLNNINTAGLYPRGQDDMLAFSLVRYAYNERKLPVFMTSGNHEAYLVPYGISPRMGVWGIELGAREKVGLSVDEHRTKLEEASQWAGKKANEGIAADHNMTIFEATLAYGPTYGHAWTSENYDPKNYDWFYVLFTPLEDAVVAVGVEPDRAGPATQVLTLLGWGQGENFLNETNFAPGGVDRQSWFGILPRATRSLSSTQFALLAQSQVHKQTGSATPWSAASHFTLINYDGPKAYSDKKAAFSPANGPTGAQVGSGLNAYNTGTCEIGLMSYFDRYTRGQGGAAPRWGPAIDHHFSGHSHRSAVYSAAITRMASRGGTAGIRVNVTQAVDPGIHGKQNVQANQHTRFIVSSCGGPIGIQNLDQELQGWTLRPPAGSLLDLAASTVEQIATARRDLSAGTPKSEKPRLCVALDYLHVMHPQKPPLSFEGGRYAAQRLSGLVEGRGAFTQPLQLQLSETVRALQCIDGIKVWVFEGGGMSEKKKPTSPVWHFLNPSLTTGKEGDSLSFNAADQATLAKCFKAAKEAGRERTSEGYEIDRCAAQAFCEVKLKKPAVAANKTNWVKDDELDWSDAWMFPLDIGAARIPAGAGGAYHLQDFMERPAGERGEVPDWRFLAQNYEDKGYVPALEAITGKKQKVN